MNKSMQKSVLVSLVSLVVFSVTFSKPASANPSVCLVPDKPVLLSPPTYSATSDSTPDFDWEDAVNASRYQIQVDDINTYASPSIDANPVASTYTPVTPLPESNYFWRVRGINDTPGCNEFGTWSDDSYFILTTAPAFDINSNWATTTPNINGRILPGEWTDAAAVDITSPGPLLSAQGSLETLNILPDGTTSPVAAESFQAALSPAATDYLPVTLYIKNTGTVLYLALDNPNDTTIDDFDHLAVYFDDNPLPSDGQWTLTTCGNADGEGNYFILAPYLEFREFITGANVCDPVVYFPPGVGGAVSYASGHFQVETSYNLQTSALRAVPGSVIGMYIWIRDGGTWVFHGKWPLTAYYQDPSTFGSLTLAQSNGATSIYFPLAIR